VCLLRGADWIFVYNSGYVFCVDLRTNSDYFPIQHWLVFITETECVYCAVRTEYLNTINSVLVFKKAVPWFRRLVAGCHRGALVRSQVTPCEICGGQSGTGTGLLRLLRFSLSISFNQYPLIFTYTLILPERQKCEAWETFKKAMLFRRSARMGVGQHFHIFSEFSSCAVLNMTIYSGAALA
jgi:hypothetical protein